MSSRMIVRSLAAIASRPALWPSAVRVIIRMAPDRWWTRSPFLPVPPASYVAFRLQTQYGGSGAPNRSPIAGRDVLNYLAWSREWENHRAML